VNVFENESALPGSGKWNLKVIPPLMESLLIAAVVVLPTWY
jgi:hypothetical protein